MSSLAAFIRALREGATCDITFFDIDLSRNARKSALAELSHCDQIARSHAPGQAPSYCQDSALWAALTLNFLCHRLVHRESCETELPATLRESEPNGSIPSQHWSVDLLFRFLADVDQRIERIGPRDPLRSTIIELAGRWPLAAIGTPHESDPARLTCILSDPCLRQQYVDRIIRRGDNLRKQHPELQSDIQRSRYDAAASCGWIPTSR